MICLHFAKVSLFLIFSITLNGWLSPIWLRFSTKNKSIKSKIMFLIKRGIWKESKFVYPNISHSPTASMNPESTNSSGLFGIESLFSWYVLARSESIEMLPASSSSSWLKRRSRQGRKSLEPCCDGEFVLWQGFASSESWDSRKGARQVLQS